MRRATPNARAAASCSQSWRGRRRSPRCFPWPHQSWQPRPSRAPARRFAWHALQLVLLGGRTGAEVEGHDWEYLLTQMNLLHMDRTIGLATHRAGLMMMIGALLWACWALPRASRHEE